MRKLLPAVVAIVAIVLSASAPAIAKGHSHHAHASHVVRSHGSRSAQRSSRHVPPGWSHGRKVGWNGGHVPPGLARH